MLAQSFLSATELRLSELEVGSLVKVLGLLDRRELVYDANPMHPSMPNGFHTGPMIQREGDNVAACICGWARIQSGNQVFGLESIMGHVMRGNKGFIALGTSGMRSANVEQAARGLRNYLTYGDPKWDEVYSIIHFEPEPLPDVVGSRSRLVQYENA